MNDAKWVTANLKDDVLGVLSDKLTDGKDYKTVDVLNLPRGTSLSSEFLEGKIVIEDDKGNVDIFHHSWFDKPTAYKKKEVECYDEDFDDLVYNIPPKEGYGYYFIRLNTLSPEQKQHFNKYCCCLRTDFLNPTQDLLMTSWDNRELKWWTNRSDLAVMSHPSWEEVRFNDIFKHRDEV